MVTIYESYSSWILKKFCQNTKTEHSWSNVAFFFLFFFAYHHCCERIFTRENLIPGRVHPLPKHRARPTAPPAAGAPAPGPGDRPTPRVVDPPWFNPDPDPDPDQGFWWPKIEKNLQLKKKLDMLLKKIAIWSSLGLHKGRTSYSRSLQPSKKNIQHFKTWKFFPFFYFCRSFLPSWIRIQ